jgi:hypothetical protein
MASSTVDDAIEQRDETELAHFGYKQELRRDWGLVHNFGISFSIIVRLFPSSLFPFLLYTSANALFQSVITGITTLFSYGLNNGGPGVMTVGWIIVAVFTFIVALGMAEIVSAIPTSGGPYFWAALLAPPKHSAFASWITGW